MNAENILAVQAQNGVAVVELNRPEKFNCLSFELHEALEQAITCFTTGDDRARCVLICAAGKHFCTGADLDTVRLSRSDPAALAAFIAAGHRTLRLIECSEVPVVVAVQGLCLAGGLELMLACDVAFAAKTAQFGDQHATYGLVPGWGGSQRLTRTIGMRRALDMLFSARRIDAVTAEHWGLVNQLCEPGELRASAISYCESLATRSRAGLATMKQLARQGFELSIDKALKFEEAIALPALLADDVSEGLSAFEERRPPKFSA